MYKTEKEKERKRIRIRERDRERENNLKRNFVGIMGKKGRN